MQAGRSTPKICNGFFGGIVIASVVVGVREGQSIYDIHNANNFRMADLQNAGGVQKYNNFADAEVVYGLSKTARHTAVMSGRLEARRRTRVDKVGLSDRGQAT